MKHNVHAVARLGAGVGVIEVRLDKIHRFQAGEILTLAGREIIDSADTLAAGEKFSGNRPSDKTSRTGYEIFSHRHLKLAQRMSHYSSC